MGFLFSRLFLMVFEKNLKIWKKHKNCFVDFSTYSKDTSRGWYHSIQHWMYFLGGIAPHAGFFIFPTFLMVFEKNLKIWKNTKIVLSISSRIVKIRVGGWYYSIQHWMYFPGGYSPLRWVFFPTFFMVFEKNQKFWKKYKKLFCRFLHV